MIEKGLCGEVLAKALRGGGEYSELFAEETDGTAIELRDGKIRNLTTGTTRGVGLRVIYGRNFVYDDRLEVGAAPPYFPTLNTFVAFTNDITFFYITHLHLTYNRSYQAFNDPPTTRESTVPVTRGIT